MRWLARWVRSGLGLVAVVLAELAVLGGVIAFGWEPAAIVALYLVAMTTTVLLAVSKILTAQETPSRVDIELPFSELRQKRGGVQVHERIPPVYPRNVPFAAVVLFLWTGGLLCYLAALVWGLGVDLTDALSPVVVLAAVLFVAARVVEFWTEYVRPGEYTGIGPQSVKPARQVVILLLLAVLSASAEPDGGSTAALSLIVLLSIFSDVFAHVTAGLWGLVAPRTEWLTTKLGALTDHPDDEPQEPVAPPAATVPDTDPTARVSPDTRAALLGVGLLAVLFIALNRFSVGYVCLLGLAALVGVGPVGLGLLALPFLLYALAKVGSLYFVHGAVEYQRRGEYIVAYDRLLSEPQWATAVRTSREVELKNRVIDRLLGTRTLELSHVDAPGDVNARQTRGNPSVQLGPVGDLDDVVDALDIPVYDTDLPERNHTLLAVGLALAGFFLVIPLAMLLSPEVSTAMTVAVMVLVLPWFLLPVGALVWASLSRI